MGLLRTQEWFGVEVYETTERRCTVLSTFLDALSAAFRFEPLRNVF